MEDGTTPLEGTDVTTADEMLKKKSGAFAQSVLRNSKQVKADRGLAIVEDTEVLYKRKVEDTTMNITRMTRKLNSMIDISPGNVIALNFDEFKADDFVEAHAKLAVDIRQEKIKLNAYKQQYNLLFGHTYELEKLD